MKNFTCFVLLLLTISGCSTPMYDFQVDHLERDAFMGKWYVQAGRFSIFEKDPYNAVETYTWNEREKRIEVDFRYNQGALDGPEKKLPQKAWIEDHPSQARWLVQPFWPLKFAYRVIALSSDGSWTAIGVPSGKYLWIMSRDPHIPRSQIEVAITKVRELGYPVEKLEYVKHSP